MGALLETFVSEPLIAVLIGMIGLLSAWFFTRRPDGIPPGPGPVLPLLGNILSVGQNFNQRLEEWRRSFGDIFSFYIGKQLFIVLNGYDALKEALVKHGEEFISRPKIFESVSNGIVLSSGNTWKEQRRFTISTLRDFGMGKKIFEEKIGEETVFFLKKMEERNGQKSNFSQLLRTATANIICSAVFGKRFEYDDEVFMTFLRKSEEYLQNTSFVSVVNFFPVTRYIPGDIFRLKSAERSKTYIAEHFVKPAIEQHVKDFNNGRKDFISAYITEVRKGGTLAELKSLNYETLTDLLLDLFFGGTDTTGATLEWAILCLMGNPVIQEKCHQEIKETIGLERLPLMSDKVNMPYMEATITEVQRMGDVLPILLYRRAAADVPIDRYTIPADSIIIPVLSSVHKDPKVYENPNVFNPERFLDSSGTFVKPEKFIPFSTGKRNCPGEPLARMELFLFLAAMIQNFKFVQPDDEERPSLEAATGVVSKPKPFRCLALKRSNFMK